MGLNVFYHFGPVVIPFDQGIGFPNTKMVLGKWLCISWRMFLIRVFGMTVALYSLPFSQFMWYNKPVSSYPYESLSQNLLLGSSINVAILMQCLSDCCKAFVLVNSTSHIGEQSSLTSTLVSFIEMSLSLGGCYSSSWLQSVAGINSQLPCFYDQVCAPPEYSCLEALWTICQV